MSPDPKPSRGAFLPTLSIVLAGLLLWLLFRGVDAARVRALVRESGPLLLLVLLPFPLAGMLDTLGFVRLLSRTGARPPAFGAALRIRLVAEAAGTITPVGVVASESVVPALLRRQGVPVPDGVAATAVRRALLMGTHGLLLALGGAAGLLGLRAAPPQSRGTLALLLVASPAVVLLAAAGLAALLGRGDAAARGHSLLLALPLGPLRSPLVRATRGFADTDHALNRALPGPGAAAPLMACYLGVWLVRAAESFLIMRLLGARLGFGQVLGAEAVMSLVRSLALVVPAGLGVQDLGYMLFLREAGVRDALTVTAGFVVVKRAKEAFWAALGLLLMPARRRAGR